MELWIRSQDKEDLIKAYNLRILNQSDIVINAEFNGSNLEYLVIGRYATKERALEVLDEIQKLLEPKFILHTTEIEKPITEYMCTIEQIKDIKELSTYVYEMPSE